MTKKKSKKIQKVFLQILTFYSNSFFKKKKFQEMSFNQGLLNWQYFPTTLIRHLSVWIRGTAEPST